MEQYTINHSEKGFLAERESHYRKIHDGWKRIFEDCTKKESVLLENIIPNRKLHEANISSDVGGYDGFVLNLVRRVYANLITKDLVSVQPMIAPVGRLFYLDPMITTGTSSNYQSMYEAHYNNTNYDVSKGSYSIITGNTSTIGNSNYKSGETFNLPYSGGIDSISSLKIFGDYIVTGLATTINGGNVTISSGYDGVFGLFDKIGCYDNNTLTNGILVTSNSTGYMTTIFSQTLPSPIIQYSFYVAPVVGGLCKWEICGSTNGTSWSLVDSRSNYNLYVESWHNLTPSNISTPYRYYMITGLTNLTGGSIQIMEINWVTGSSATEEMTFAVSPQTWGEELLSSNQINIMASQTGSTFDGDISIFGTWKEYNSLEGTSGFQQVKLNVTSTTVETTSRKLYSHLTEELLQDAEAYFGLNFEADLAELMSTEVAAEIDREIIQDLINIAPYRSEWYYDVAEASAATSTWYQLQEVPRGYTQHTWAQESLITEINKMDGQLRKANIYHGANWLLCSTKVGMVIESMKEHKVIKGNSVINKTKIHRTGRLRSSIDVYVDPYLPDNICLMGYNGDNWDAGYIYAPYVLVNSDTVIDPDTLFDHYLSFHSRYGKKIVTNKKYGLINCHFPSGGEFELVNEV